jgi:signal transduction histidine kinase
MTAPSIRRRLADAMLLWSLLWSVGVAIAVGLAAQHEVEELLDETLRSTALMLGHAVTLADATAPAVVPAVGDAEFAWQLVDNDGRVLRRTANAPTTALLRAGSAGISEVADWRVHASALPAADGRGARTLIVAHTQEERREAQSEVIISAVLAALSIGLLGHLWLRGRVRQELLPLDRLSERLLDHDPLDAAQSLGQAERAELAPVHAALERLGERLAQRLANERRVAAHAAHALRTPLAGIDAQLAVALRESPPEARARLQRVRDASSRLQHVVRSLLELFRLGGEVQRRPVTMGELLAHLPMPGLEVSAADPAARLEADPDLLSGALLNLFDNALRHGAQRVVVSVPAAARVRVADDGRGTEPQRLAQLRDAVRTQHYDGTTGLGLMLADLVSRAHGGRLELPDAADGFVAELVLRGEGGAPATGGG